MRALHSFDYAVLRIAPSVERGEFINAGIAMHCPERGFLRVRVQLDEERLRALWPSADIELISEHLEAFPRVCEGRPEGGPIAKLSRRERFHWMVSPRSTMIQVSPVHSGLCEDPDTTFENLFRKLVARPEGAE